MQQPGSTLRIELGGTNPATPQFDQLAVSGNVTLAGNLELSLLNPFVPVPGDIFEFIHNDGLAAISGQFDNLIESAIIPLGGAYLRLTYAGGDDDGNDVVLTAISPFIVTTTGDTGVGSLRQAILDANTLPGRDIIVFNIPGAGVHTIQPIGFLPGISESVVIDGYSQPGTRQNTLTIGTDAVLLIEIDGSLAAASASGLHLGAGNSLIQGLVINRFNGQNTVSGIHIVGTHSARNVIRGNYLGTDPTGMIDRGNNYGLGAYAGQLLLGGSLPADRNVISGNDVGVTLQAGSATVLGNYFGLGADGSTRLGNCAGVDLEGAAVTLGGLGPGEGNIISDNVHGIYLAAGNGTPIQGNYIGTDATGLLGRGNHLDGILMGGNGVRITGNVIADNPHGIRMAMPATSCRAT